MTPQDWEALNKGLDLIGTPLALETLQALTNGTDPYAGDVDNATVDNAVALLRSLDTVTGEGTELAATDRGRALYHRLVEIEQGINLTPRRRPNNPLSE